ncbi:MAG TPA: hypothetical protein VGH79_02720 [Gaiellaceae bacterium]|jgi:hypothetical protein
MAIVALAAAAIALVVSTTKAKGELAAPGHEELGLAFSQRNTDAFAAGGDEDSPMSYADQMAELNAYPAHSISAQQLAAARIASATLNKKGPKGRNSTTSWFSLGPQQAVYPAITNRSGSRYVASGRISALAIKPGCNAKSCTVWAGSAGGGVWRTDKGLSGDPKWTNVSDGYFASGAIGSLLYDAASKTLYAGTGELGAAQDTEAGVGIYKSTNDGSTWTPLAGNAVFQSRAIRQIAIDPNNPNVMYVADGRGVHGLSATNAGPVSLVPGAPPWGLYRSTDGGQSFSIVSPGANGATFNAPRGFTDVAFDPTHAGVIYTSSYGQGIYRSTDNGATWTLINPCVVTCSNADRSEFSLATLPNGDTRMYAAEGDSGPPTDNAGNITQGDVAYSRFFVADGVQSGSPTFDDKTTDGLSFYQADADHYVADPTSPSYATYNFCTGQCWYDEQVYSPAGSPNIVYLLGSYTYGEDLGSQGNGLSNGRAVLLSRDGGNTWTDLTADGTSPKTPNMLHPDQHALITVPGKPLQFIEGSDGGLMRSDGTLANTSSRCNSRTQLPANWVAVCKSLLSAVPGAYTSLNKGLQTLQFQYLSVNPANSHDVQGGTQDNGTFETNGSTDVWPQTVGGDGGMSGFDAANAKFRFHSYYYQQFDVNFASGNPTGWDWISDPLFTNEVQDSLFYTPAISDPVVSGSMFAGITWIWRTQDDGGQQAYLDQHCNERTGDFQATCGDWQTIGGAQYGDNSDFTHSPTYSTGTRLGGLVSWVQRSTADTGTLWASTTLGRIFVSHNANAANPDDVVLTRIDNLTGGSALPGRAISSIYVDPTNPNHAWISYLGYNANTPGTPGHVFSVTYDPNTSSVSVQSLDYDFGDQPMNSVVENTNGDLYAATDFGVYRLPNGGSAWAPAANDLPVVTVSSLTINPAAHQLLAATHGRGAYQLTLP